MAGNHMWLDVERQFLQDAYNRGLSDPEIVKAMADAGYNRSLTAIRTARSCLDLTTPTNSQRLPKGWRTIEEQDEAFCDELRRQIAVGNETGGWKLAAKQNSKFI